MERGFNIQSGTFGKGVIVRKFLQLFEEQNCIRNSSKSKR
jgi:hypothetical protein